MDAKKCDRCGEFEEGLNTVDDLKIRFAGKISGGKHLCRECKTEFTEWWLSEGDN